MKQRFPFFLHLSRTLAEGPDHYDWNSHTLGTGSSHAFQIVMQKSLRFSEQIRASQILALVWGTFRNRSSWAVLAQSITQRSELVPLILQFLKIPQVILMHREPLNQIVLEGFSTLVILFCLKCEKGFNEKKVLLGTHNPVKEQGCGFVHFDL